MQLRRRFVSNRPISFIIDADIARSAGTTEHPISSGSRKLLENVALNGHVAAMCPNLRQEWRNHQSIFATKWLASMIAKKKVNFIKPTQDIRNFIEKNIVDCKNKEIALKDAHLLDAALKSDKIIASNDNTARAVFCELSKKNGSISTISWFNSISDSIFISETLMSGGFIPSNYYLFSSD